MWCLQLPESGHGDHEDDDVQHRMEWSVDTIKVVRGDAGASGNHSVPEVVNGMAGEKRNNGEGDANGDDETHGDLGRDPDIAINEDSEVEK